MSPVNKVLFEGMERWLTSSERLKRTGVQFLAPRSSQSAVAPVSGNPASIGTRHKYACVQKYLYT